MQTITAWILAALALAGCNSDADSSSPGASSTLDAAPDAAVDGYLPPDASSDVALDAPVDVLDSSDDADVALDVSSDAEHDAESDTNADAAPEGGPEPPGCDQLGLPVRPFQSGPDDPSLHALAADFTVPTWSGDWTLSEHWSGCDVYLFIQDQPRQAKGWPIPLWDRDVAELFSRMPSNVHLFFLPTETDPADIAAALEGLRTNVDAALLALPQPERLAWTSRVHYVTTSATQLDGWLGDVMTSPAWGVGIDRFQRIRYIGSYADPYRFDDTEQWFEPNLSMAANEAIYYDFEATRELTLDDADTVVPLFDDVDASTNPTVDVQLPDAAAMTGFDTLEIDLMLGCDGAGEYGDCPAWDYIVGLYLCDEGDPTACDTEIGRWITSYHREGRWVHDVSPLLPLIASGGARRLQFRSQDPWVLSASLRLSNQGKALRATHIWPLFETGSADGFDEGYNDLFDAVTIAIPSSTQRVEIASAITGHGMSMPGNCAEFCNSQHDFLVNGDVFTRYFPIAGSALGCMNQVDEGTVPNQYGTWWYGRSGWCPGKEVPLETVDVTASIVVGGDNTIDFQAWYQGKPYTGDNWRHFTHRSWLVAYE